MKVYTKTGDGGLTSLIGGERVFKSDERVEAYGTVDELTAFIAVLSDKMSREENLKEYVEQMQRVVSRLMSVEALLAKSREESKVQPLAEEEIQWLEQRIDGLQAEVRPIDKFTIPGGNETASWCHVCRTVCRRAERAAIRADQLYGIEPSALKYLNRLSDYFYLLGRRLTEYFGVEETLWIP